jgi:hypothetical protein
MGIHMVTIPDREIQTLHFFRAGKMLIHCHENTKGGA